MKIFVNNNAIFKKEKVVKANVGQLITKLLENSELLAKAPRISISTVKFGKKHASEIL